MKVNEWLEIKKKKPEYIIDTTIGELSENHHYISPVYDAACVKLGNNFSDDLQEFLDRYTKVYKMYIWLPDSFNYYNTTEGKFIIDYNFVKSLLTYDGIQGIILNVGSVDMVKSKAFYGFRQVFLKRLVPLYSRNETKLYLANSLNADASKGFTLSDLLLMRGRDKNLHLNLCLYESVMSGARFMETYKGFGSLGAVPRNYDMLTLSDAKSSGEEVCIGNPEGTFSIYDYVAFMKEFKYGKFIIKGNLEDKLRIKEKILKLGKGNG